MSITDFTEKWCSLSGDAKVVIVTNGDRVTLANDLQNCIKNKCEILIFAPGGELMSALVELSPSDLVIALFGFNTFVFGGANGIFSPFSKPQGVSAKYAFVRLGISMESLFEGLSTPKELIYNKIDELRQYKNGTCLRITNDSGTDIALRINPFTTCSHEITADGEMAFLPPSETSSDVIANNADGRIVADVTVGQLYHYGELLGSFGLVDQPVILTVENGIVVDITGGKMAAELKGKLFSLPAECRELVELGHGLSKMTPTGLIGVDESIIDTCHFGIGDGAKCGVHLDVVVNAPTITEVE